MKNYFLNFKDAIMDYLESSTDKLEETVNLFQNSMKANSASPKRVTILDSKKKLPKVTLGILSHLIPIKFSLTNGRKKAIKSLKNNPSSPKRAISEAELCDFEMYTRSLGIGTIGYTKLTEKYIFKDKAVLFKNAIILVMEMDKDKYNTAPSIDSMYTVINTYSRLGEATNSLADYLRKNGFAVHAGHPYKGLVLYPPLAVKSGIGWYGRHGLLITPEFGPRQRIAAIFTSIENLPFSQRNEHSWIGDFCKKCGRCIKACPGGAIQQTPIINENELITHIDNTKCFPQFYDNCSCGICIKECIFNKKSYEEIKKAFLKC